MGLHFTELLQAQTRANHKTVLPENKLMSSKYLSTCTISECFLAKDLLSRSVVNPSRMFCLSHSIMRSWPTLRQIKKNCDKCYTCVDNCTKDHRAGRDPYPPMIHVVDDPTKQNIFDYQFLKRSLPVGSMSLPMYRILFLNHGGTLRSVCRLPFPTKERSTCRASSTQIVFCCELQTTWCNSL